jgi:chemotaxis signal transduction protein
MEVVNFRVGNRIVAFNILNILLTEKFDNGQTSVPSEDTAFLGIKDFMGVPTPIYDLGVAMNKESTQKKNTDLIDLFHQYEKEQDLWLTSLENCVVQNSVFNKSKSYELSEYGKWYANFSSENQDLAEVLKKIETPIRKLYEIADPVLALNEQQDDAIKIIHHAKQTFLASVKRLFETARDQVAVTYKPVTVFTTTDGQKPSLGFVVDKVEDSLTITDEQIKQLSDLDTHVGAIDHRVKQMIVSLITTDSENSLLLKPEAFL